MLNLSRITSGIEIETAPLPAETGLIPHHIAVLGQPSETYAESFESPIVIADSQEAAETFGEESQLTQMVKCLDGVAASITCFALKQPTTNSLDLSLSFQAMGSTWYTMAVLPDSLKSTLDQAIDLAKNRGATDVNMPMLCVAGNVQDYAEINTLVQSLDNMAMMVVHVPGSPTSQHEIAADEVYKRIMVSQEQPNISGRNTALRYTIPGPKELSPAQKEALTRSGGATTSNRAGAVYVDNDATTSKTIDGKTNDVFRWAGNVLNYIAKIHALKTMFDTPPFDDYIIMDQSARTSSTHAVKPGTVKQYLSTLMEEWERLALSKNIEAMKASINVEVPKGNPQAYLISFMDDLAVSGKRIFVRYSPKVSSKV